MANNVSPSGTPIVEYPKWVRKDDKEVIVNTKEEEDAFFGKGKTKPAGWGEPKN